APHEVMIELVVRRLLEGGDLAALRIDAVEHSLDRGILARGIHALEDEEQRPAILSVELFLEIVETLAVGLDDLLAVVLVEPALLAGLLRGQVEFTRAVDAEWGDEGGEIGGEGGCRLFGH